MYFLGKNIIVVDGVDRIGKTTFIKYLKNNFLKALGYNVKVFKEDYFKTDDFKRLEDKDKLDYIQKNRVDFLNDINNFLNLDADNFAIIDRLEFSTWLYQYSLSNNYKFRHHIFTFILIPKSNQMIEELKKRMMLEGENVDDFYNKRTLEILKLMKKARFEDKTFLEIIKIDNNHGIVNVFMKILPKLIEMFPQFLERFVDVEIKNKKSLIDFKLLSEIFSISKSLKPHTTLDKKKLIHFLNKGHLTPIEFFNITFFIQKIPRYVLQELRTYRVGISYVVQSTRAILKKIDENDLQDYIYKFGHPINRLISIDTMRYIMRQRETLGTNDLIKESLPELFTTSLFLNVNIRELIHIIRQRQDITTHKEFRRLVFSMLYSIMKKDRKAYDFLCEIKI